MTRWMTEGHQLKPRPDYQFSDHRRVAKKRTMTILNTRKKETRVAAYRDLVGVAYKVCGYAREAIPVLGKYRNDSFQDGCTAHLLAQKLECALRILEKVIDQTERRVFKDEKVPASEKIISFFEIHSDIIVKSRWDTQFSSRKSSHCRQVLLIACNFVCLTITDILEKPPVSDRGLFISNDCCNSEQTEDLSNDFPGGFFVYQRAAKAWRAAAMVRSRSSWL